MAGENSHLISIVEKIQERSFKWLDEDIDDVLKFNDGKNSSDKKSSGLSQEQITGSLESVFPEKLFLDNEKLEKDFFQGGFTQYDNKNFIARFANTKEYLHTFFSDVCEVERLNIEITSLPFLPLNGVCSKINDKYLIFLNQGILAVLPALYRELLPSMNPIYFGDPQPGYLARLLDIYTYVYMSGRSSSTFGGKIKYYSLGETWYFAEFLRENIASNIEIDDFPPPHQIPLTMSSARYYANKGATVFILAHEFAHAYRAHVDTRQNVETLRSKEELISAWNMLNDHGLSITQIETILKQNKGYLVHQPQEIEADVFAILATIQFCEEIELSPEATECLLLGAVSIFVVLEIYDRLILMTQFGASATCSELERGSEFRNVFHCCEHPIAISRPELIANSPIVSNLNEHPYIQELKNLATNLEGFTNHIWEHMTQFEDIIVKEIKKSPYIQGMPDDLFSELNSVGDIDFSHSTRKPFL